MLALTLNTDYVGDDDSQVFHLLDARGQLTLILLLHLAELLLKHLVFV